MKTVKLILGNITFNEDGTATVHEIDALINCESVERAGEIGDEFVNEYDAYLVPESFAGEIWYECDENILTN